MDKLIQYITNPLFLVLIAFILLLLAFNILQRLSRGRVWKQIAAETGLQFSQQHAAAYRDRQLSGLYRNRPLTLVESELKESRADQRRRSQGTSQDNTDTEIRIRINVSKVIKMRLNRIITVGKAAQVTGDAEIDNRFDITSEPDWLAKKVLISSNVHEKLSQLKMGSCVLVQEAELRFIYAGRISDGRYLRFLFDFLVDLADSMEAAALNVS